MRDAHRMKEKFDVSLDNRQIVSLLIAGIVVMGAVFVLGVVVGKKLSGDAQTAAAPDLLSALDANAQVLHDARQEPPLTFPDELTRKASADPLPPLPTPKPAAKPEAPKATAAKPEVKPEPAKVAAKPTLAPTPDPDTGELPAQDEASDEAPAVVVKPEVKPEAPKAATVVAAKPEVKPEPVKGKVEETPVATRTAARDGGMKEAIARAQQLPAEPPRPAEAVKGGAFTLQLSAFQSRPDADRFAARLRDRGYAPYILAAEVPGKGTWYRVRMGSFASKEAAGRYLTDFKRETQLDAYVAGTN
ncbi:SPOR domain-containing protein [Corallococcus praedator]|uniref:SPOR domain-containing protein n=1 Tax=Corallococcus praedator TaxID=2316724 RepID=A0ABX9QQM7_9BACT|nr:MULTISPECIES: SPOR domain-containing protein [Corallococcus]RKH21824.1 SPOR domain-containing protein [Corallococcus sp. CA047B]RKH36505.1 SPOR domain-containing protein [Corallococcus sp. CA031C]RKI16340.1 SPOR domain-containing protein [Corallococcus praedator]